MRRVARLAFCLIVVLGSNGAAAQENAAADEVADLEPAVDTSPSLRGPVPRPGAAEAPPAAAAGGPSSEPAAAPPARAAPATRVAVDSLDLGTTSITGNQELPKVLYIVPWKRSDLGDVVGRPVNTLLDEVLAPIDPEVFERHLSYYETLHGETRKE